MNKYFYELFIIFFISSIFNFLLSKFKITSTIGFLITGAFIRFFLGNKLESFEILSELGICLLILEIGLEMKKKTIASLKPFSIKAIFSIIFTGLLNFVFFYFFYSKNNNKIILSILTSLSTTASVINELREKKIYGSRNGKFTLTILIVQDFLSILLLILHGKNDINIFFHFFKIFFLIFSCFFIRSYLITKLKLFSNNLLVFLFSSIFFGFLSLTEYLKLGSEIGAFCCGIIFAESDIKNDIEEYLFTIKQIFLSFFFIIIGNHLDFISLKRDWKITIFFSLGILILKTISYGVFFINLKKKKIDLIYGFLLSSIGELSLLIMQKENILINNVFILVVIFSNLIASFLHSEIDDNQEKVSLIICNFSPLILELSLSLKHIGKTDFLLATENINHIIEAKKHEIRTFFTNNLFDFGRFSKMGNIETFIFSDIDKIENIKKIQSEFSGQNIIIITNKIDVHEYCQENQLPVFLIDNKRLIESIIENIITDKVI